MEFKMLSVQKLIPAVVLAMSLAPFAANARTTRPPLPPQSQVTQTYALSAFSERHGRAAEQPFTQAQNNNVNIAQQFMNKAPSNNTDDTAGG
jgi:hypothetical protein